MGLHGLSFLLAFQRVFHRFPAIGSRLLIERGSAEDIFKTKRERFRPFFGRNILAWALYSRFNDWRAVECDEKNLEQLSAQLVSINDGAYPRLLKEIYDPPPVLTVLGKDISILNSISVSIVGARRASQRALSLSAEIAGGLSQLGFTVTSGLAYGVDSSAHRGTLHADGRTIAVLGSGLCRIYPEAHRGLAEEIAKEGLVISEFPPDSGPLKQNFPQRNRVISGMSVATVVVEAAERSGSLITAGFALEQNREVFAVPGAGGRVDARGTNRLISEGAELVEGPADVAFRLARFVPQAALFKKSGHFGEDVDKESKILGALSKRKKMGADEIVLAARMPVNEVLRELSQFVISGDVEELPGRLFRLKGK